VLSIKLLTSETVQIDDLWRIRSIVLDDQFPVPRTAIQWIELYRYRTDSAHRERRLAGGVAGVNRKIRAALYADAANVSRSIVPPWVEEQGEQRIAMESNKA